ncbi:MAG: prepilin-type N-terminal cleavage/methylation domain-containing protein [Clostridia bacterium]|nr:prepilin-type N-terminal cleavage/methylation domain-containing protein [Clostridia bacterium]
MYKLYSSKKGMTLTEVMVSLAVLGILSVPLMMTFTNSIMVTKLTQDQIEVNAITRIVKKTVTNAVKYAYSPIKTFDAAANGTAYNATADGVILREDATGFNSGVNLIISDSDGNIYNKYAFNAEFERGPRPLINYDPEFPNTCQYLVTIFRNDANNRVVARLRLDINLLED